MAQLARTASVGTSVENVAVPTEGGMLRLVNLDGTNNVWVSQKRGTAATVGGDESEVILPGGELYVQHPGTTGTLSMIADTGACLVNISVKLGR